MPALYRVLVWSLNALASGLFPTHDHEGRKFDEGYYPLRAKVAGTPLAGGFRGVFSELRGDWKYQVESLCLTRSYLSLECCHLCKAHKNIERLWYTRNERNSVLRKTLITHAGFRDEQRGRPVDRQSPFLDLIGFHIWFCLVDAMHCLDLGVYQSLAASGLLFAVQRGVWEGANIQERFYRAHAQYSEWCKTHHYAPCPPFMYAKLCPSNEYPAFTQQLAKAAATKHLMEWLFTIFDAPGFISDDDDETYLVWLLFQQWHVFEAICKRSSRFLSEAVVPELVEATELALKTHSVLHARATARGLLRWQIQPKQHMASHLGYDMAGRFRLNPRCTTNYADEDFVGKIKKIMASCHGRTAGRMGVSRYIILIGLRWFNQLAKLRHIRP